MTTRIGAIYDAIHIGDTETVTGNDEPLRAIDEAYQRTVKAVLADVFAPGISHKDAFPTDSQGAIVGIPAACLPLLLYVSTAVIHLNARGEQGIYESFVNGNVANIAGRGEIGLQFTTQPIHRDVVGHGNVNTTLHYLYRTNVIGYHESKHTTVRRNEITIFLQQNRSLRSLGVIKEFVGTLEHIPHLTSHDGEYHSSHRQRTRYLK